MLFFLSFRGDRGLFIKDIVLKMLTPNRLLCVILLIAGYQLVSVIHHFWLTQAASVPGLSRVSAPETAVTGDQTEERFVLRYSAGHPHYHRRESAGNNAFLSDDLLSGGGS